MMLNQKFREYNEDYVKSDGKPTNSPIILTDNLIGQSALNQEPKSNGEIKPHGDINLEKPNELIPEPNEIIAELTNQAPLLIPERTQSSDEVSRDELNVSKATDKSTTLEMQDVSAQSNQNKPGPK